MGKESASKLAANVGSLSGLLDLGRGVKPDQDESGSGWSLEAIEGVGPITAEGIVNWYALHAFLSLFFRLIHT